MWTALIGPIAGIIGKVVDKAVPDKDLAERLKAEMITQVNDLSKTELEGAVKIIVAEAQSESWITRNWRPITMLSFVGLIGAHWLGFTPPNLPEEQVLALLEIVKVGLGGYVIGRSTTQTVKAWKAGKE